MNKHEASLWRHVMDVSEEFGEKKMEMEMLFQENEDLKKRNKILTETLIQLKNQIESEDKQAEEKESDGV